MKNQKLKAKKIINISTQRPPVTPIIVPDKNIFQKIPFYFWVFLASIIFVIVVAYFLLKNNDSSIYNPSQMPTPPPPPTPGITIPSWVNNGSVMPYISRTSALNPQTIVVYNFVSGDSGIIIGKVNNSSVAGSFEYTADYTTPFASSFYSGGIGGDSSMFNTLNETVSIKTKSISTTENTTYYKIIMIAKDVDYTYVAPNTTIPVNIYTGKRGDFGIFMGASPTAIGALYFFEYLSNSPTVNPIWESNIICNFTGNTLTALAGITSNPFRYCYKLFGNIDNITKKTVEPSTPFNLYTLNSGDCGFIFVQSYAGIGLAFFEWTNSVTSAGIQNILNPAPSSDIRFSILNSNFSVQVTSVVGGSIKYCVVLI